MQIKRYSRIEPMIFIWFMLPYTLLINLLLFGSCVLGSASGFLSRLGISLVYFALIYSLFGMVAVLVKKRFPGDHELFRRIVILLPLFSIMNLLTVQGAYLLYEGLSLEGCPVRRYMEWWVTGYGCLMSAILTFINEAGVGWEKWRAAMRETDRLQSAYQKSRLLSLKRQLHPHFLFNCFNTLSSLIQENEEEAEKFLDELTKVYRYLLKGAEEQLIDLHEELRFIESYLYLVKTRFGSALEVEIDTDMAYWIKKIAPMSLLVVLENIIYRNAFSKTLPLQIEIRTQPGSGLVISNNLQPKPFAEEGYDQEEGLDDLVSKYRLLGGPVVEIQETAKCRTIMIPLIEKTETPL
ncbi:MAG: histidine kinase [Bacteroidetes bacterium]|nr:histidine kinase [Bacteroidota bacterium]